jgi:hypothetical protein
MVKETTGAKKDAQDKEREALAKELRSVIPKLDSEGLAFLVKQARVHLYNMKVDELNKAAQDAYSASVRQKAVKARKQKPRKGGKFEFKPTDSGSGYYLFYQNSNTVFTKAEMTAMAKIAWCAESDLEIRDRLFRWLYNERRDIFKLVPIKDKFDDKLKTLVALIKKSFKLRKQ